MEQLMLEKCRKNLVQGKQNYDRGKKNKSEEPLSEAQREVETYKLVNVRGVFSQSMLRWRRTSREQSV